MSLNNHAKDFHKHFTLPYRTVIYFIDAYNLFRSVFCNDSAEDVSERLGYLGYFRSVLSALCRCSILTIHRILKRNNVDIGKFEL